MTAKLKNLSDEFDEQIRAIPPPAGSPAYVAKYEKVVSDMQRKVHEMQNTCRDALQKGKPLMGTTEDIDKAWRDFLNVVEP